MSRSRFISSRRIAQFTGIGRDKVFPAYLSVRVNIPMVMILALGATGSILAFWWAPEARSILIFATATLAALAGLYASFCASSALKLRTLLTTLHRTIELSNIVTSMEMTRVRALIYDIDVKKLTPVELFDTIMRDIDIRHAVMAVLNSLETVSIAVQTGYANEEVLHASLSFIVPFVYRRLQPFIVLYRKKYNSEELYIELQKLSTSWESGKYLASSEDILERLVFKVAG